MGLWYNFGYRFWGRGVPGTILESGEFTLCTATRISLHTEGRLAVLTQYFLADC